MAVFFFIVSTSDVIIYKYIYIYIYIYMFISSCYFVLLVCFAPQMHPTSQFDKTVLSKTVFVIIYIYILPKRSWGSPMQVPDLSTEGTGAHRCSHDTP